MNENSIETVIGDDIQFRGKLKFHKGLKIKGFFKGTIESDGQLFIGNTGEVEADIDTSQIEIEGKLTGNILAKDKVAIRRSGSVTGDIHTPSLEVETGAKFRGNCVM